MMELTPGNVTLAQLETVYRDEVAVTLNPSCKPAVEDAAARINEAAQGDARYAKLAAIYVPGALAEARAELDKVALGADVLYALSEDDLAA